VWIVQYVDWKEQQRGLFLKSIETQLKYIPLVENRIGLLRDEASDIENVIIGGFGLGVGALII
jgi:hypothetical protein